ncbi:MAG TPA: arginine deiminase family protein [Candidatus Paceibacterota bacterium]|nr:arginine deiminase family protein [Candidatus Paceibacterota bacterium]
MKSAEARIALVRPVPNSYDHCVRTNSETIDVELARLQHGTYCKMLQKLGLRLVWVERDDHLADSCFVEDTAVVLGERAVICNMSVKSRAPEVVDVAKTLKRFKQLYYIRSPATIDGGDVLKAEDAVFIGLSARTNIEAVNQIREISRDLGLEVVPLKVRNVLHLKSACTYLGDNCVILSRGNFKTDELSGLRKIIVPKGEEYAADCLAVNKTVLMAKGHPKTKKLVVNEGFQVEELDVSEFRKGEGALTCLSIIL